mmetsp:Transcript_30101/g.71624  ORF Transcript_30101/g.71624 Transcript_30101/m.71624 type:complete len:353 (+) Transcript_30101:94-1152(+)
MDNDSVIRSPLRFLGPYPTVPLKFPRLSTPSQREKDLSGISLDFVLDTAANVNTLNAQVAKELNLEAVGEVPGGYGAAGEIAGAETYMLGDCSLDLSVLGEKKCDDEDEQEDEIFMQGLTASALPVASPAAAGLLGLAFFYCFEGGVEMVWQPNEESPTPSITFHGSIAHLNTSGLSCIQYESLPVSLLPSVTICINGVEIPALFDTGSPITCINKQAAEAAGIEPAVSLDEFDDEDGGANSNWNPFAKITANVKAAQKVAQAASQGQLLTLAGGDGPVQLIRSKSSEKIDIRTKDGVTDLAESQLFIGDIPGLQALGGLGGDAPPAAVLGMDIIARRPRVIFRARQNQIYL